MKSLSKRLSTALEAISAEPVTLLKITQDDFDDGVQTLVLHYSDGNKETVKRVWPEMRYRGNESGDSLHERYVTLTESIDSPDKLWSTIQALTISEEQLTVSMETTHGLESIFGKIFGDVKKPALRPKNVYKTYQATYLNAAWLSKQQFNETVTLSELKNAAVIDGKFCLDDPKEIDKLCSVLLDLGIDETVQNPKNLYLGKLNDLVLNFVEKLDSGDVTALAKKLRDSLRVEIRKLVPKTLPGGLVLKDPMSDERFDRVTTDVENLPALDAKSVVTYAKLALHADRAIDALTYALQNLNDAGLGYGYENHSVNSEFAFEIIEASEESFDDVIAVLKTINDAAKDLLHLIDEYLHKSIK